MSVSWFSRAEKTAFATVYKTNITINTVGSYRLNSAYAALLGIDKAQKHVIIKPIDKDKADSGTIDQDMLFALSGGKTYTRVSSTDFVSKIAELTGCDYAAGGRKYACHFEEDEKALIIDLNKEVS